MSTIPVSKSLIAMQSGLAANALANFSSDARNASSASFLSVISRATPVT